MQCEKGMSGASHLARSNQTITAATLPIASTMIAKVTQQADPVALPDFCRALQRLDQVKRQKAMTEFRTFPSLLRRSGSGQDTRASPLIRFSSASTESSARGRPSTCKAFAPMPPEKQQSRMTRRRRACMRAHHSPRVVRGMAVPATSWASVSYATISCVSVPCRKRDHDDVIGLGCRQSLESSLNCGDCRSRVGQQSSFSADRIGEARATPPHPCGRNSTS
jgi:hypothetical protein